jgi:integral membrane sensor domain MASE1
LEGYSPVQPFFLQLDFNFTDPNTLLRMGLEMTLFLILAFFFSFFRKIPMVYSTPATYLLLRLLIFNSMTIKRHRLGGRFQAILQCK